jgi:peptide/nickel transport system ATP-binding protein
MSQATPLLSVEDLHVEFATYGGTVQAVRGVSFSVEAGQTLGIVGESGCGKSVCVQSIMGLIPMPPGRITAGRARLRGVDILGRTEIEGRDIRGREVGMIFQDPMTSLNPVHTIGRQMDEMLRLHTELDAPARRARSIEMLAEVGIPEPESRLKQYPHQFSGGMRQRVVIAIALLAEPKLIIADEPTTALDVTIQAQILRLMKARVRERGTALILITHDLAVVGNVVDRITVLYAGRVVEQGPAQDVLGTPRHPYTDGLIGSIPSLHDRKPRLDQIPGTVPDVRNLPAGCAFRDRCARAQARCAEERPELRQIEGSTQVAACHFPVPQSHSRQGGVPA